MKNVDNNQSKTTTVGTSVDHQVNDISDQIANQNIYHADCDSVRTEDNCVSVTSNNLHLRKHGRLNQYGSIETKLLIESGSVHTIIYKSLANPVVGGHEHSFWTTTTDKKDLKTCSNNIIKTVNTIITTVNCNDWKAENVNINFVEDCHQPIIGRDLFQLLVLSKNQ